jgi:hypothetical protein
LLFILFKSISPSSTCAVLPHKTYKKLSCLSWVCFHTYSETCYDSLHIPDETCLCRPPVTPLKCDLFKQVALTYSWSWALLEKPTIVQLLKNFPAFNGARRFIRAPYWSLSWARSLQSILAQPI